MTTDTATITADELTALRDELARLRSRNLRLTQRVHAAATLCHTAKAGGRVGVIKADDVLRALDAH